MKVILQKNVDKLGKVGDIVEAAPGYYRNYLQPRGFAILASDGALKKREEDLEQLRKKAEAAHQEAVSLGEKVAGLGTIRIDAKAGEGGRLYGKVTNKEIAHVLSEKLGVEIDKRTVKTAEDISSLGTYKAHVRLTSEVQTDILVEVLPHGFVASAPRDEAAKEPAAEAETSEEEQES